MSVPPSGMPEPTRRAALGVWALFVGMGLLMLGNGLQGSLLGVRATDEGFPSRVTGMIMTGYYLGFLAGSLLTPVAVRHVGHIRVFAALASLASMAILVHSVFVTPVVWMGMRFVTGFTYAGLYVVSESWLNDRAGNTQRGGLLAIYMVVSYLGMGGGHLLLNVADPNAFALFILSSVIISFALIPILLSAATEPSQQSVPDPIGLTRLFRLVPLGVIGSLASGIAQGVVFGMGAVYASTAGLSVAEVSIFMSVFIVGAALFQWPAGWLSDRMDRRWVIAGSALAAAAFAPIAAAAAEVWPPGLIVMAGLMGGTILTLYSVIIAYTNDFLEPPQMVAASSTLVLATGIGALLGPSVTGLLMERIGPNGFWFYLGGLHLFLGVLALVRIYQSPTYTPEQQRHYVGLPPSSSDLAQTWAEESEQATREAAEGEQDEEAENGEHAGPDNDYAHDSDEDRDQV